MPWFISVNCIRLNSTWERRRGLKMKTEFKEVTCYIHHLSDFVHSAREHHFTLTDIEEYFDEEDKQGVPRILRLLFRK